ncbi:tRNA (adenosine(37)-N6)-threonylcarbamoyltransferase complex ATPase subunit type 1 TsaE [Desulfatiferula olefinivorans]
MTALSDRLCSGSPFTLIAPTLADTHRIGRELGALAEPGTVICLAGDLGSGKTALVQGLARGLGVPDAYYVTSPSYTLVNAYPGRLPLYHLDLYRIEDPEDVWDLGIDEMLADGGVLAVEWPDRLPPGFFEDYLRIEMVIGRDDARQLYFQRFSAGLG